MRIAKKDDIPEMAAFMPEFWEWVKKNYYYDGSDEAMDLLYDSSSELMQKYPNEPMVKVILFGLDPELRTGLVTYLHERGKANGK